MNYKRGTPAHPSPIEKHNTPTILLLTVAVTNRECILANDQAHHALIQAWENARNWVVGYYMVMPDHVHLFCAPAGCAREKVKTWTAYWKRLAGDAMPSLRGRLMWDCWDTQMRSGDHYYRKLQYVAQNPVRKELVANSEEWPYQGRLNELSW